MTDDEVKIKVDAFIELVRSKKHRAERVDGWLTALRAMEDGGMIKMERDVRLLYADLMRKVFGISNYGDFDPLWHRVRERYEIIDAICDAYDCAPTGMVWVWRMERA